MLEKITLMILFAGFFLLMAYLDKRFDLGLSQTSQTSTNSKGERLQEQNKELRSRVEVLERIVTEPKYELNKELSKLA